VTHVKPYIIMIDSIDFISSCAHHLCSPFLGSYYELEDMESIDGRCETK